MDDIILTKQDYERAAALENKIVNTIAESHVGGRALREAAELRRDLFLGMARYATD